jgi:8-oxo-dGTP diphosphatase
MQAYVAGFMFDEFGNVALVRKLKPRWQAGKLNGIGGKIEPNEETPLFAMRREWKEETGNDHADWQHFVSIKGQNSIVHFFKATVADLPRFDDCNDVGEEIVCAAAMSEYVFSQCVPNLRWLIPLALDGSGFSVTMLEAA